MTKTPEQKQDCVASQMAEEYLRYENESYYWAKHAFLAGYEAAKPQWISVKDRLPELDQYVLVTHRTSDDYTNLKVMEGCRISDQEYEIWGDYAILADYVDYWMPLPEAPKDE